MEEQNTTFDDVNRVRGVKWLIEKFERMNVHNVHISGAPDDWNLKNLTGRVAERAAKLEMGSDSINEDPAQWIAEPKDEILKDIAGQVKEKGANIEHNIFPFEIGTHTIVEEKANGDCPTEVKDKMLRYFYSQIDNNIDNNNNELGKSLPTKGSSNDTMIMSSRQIKKTPTFNGFNFGKYSNNLLPYIFNDLFLTR